MLLLCLHNLSRKKLCGSWVQMRGYQACVFGMPIPLRVCLAGALAFRKLLLKKYGNLNNPQNSILNNSTSCFTIEPWIHKHEEKWLQVSYLSFSYAASFLTMCLTAQSFRRAFRIRFLRVRGLMAPGLNMPSAASGFQSRRQLSVCFAVPQEIPDIYQEHRLF